MASLEDRARKARVAAREAGIAASETVSRNAKTNKVNLTLSEERKAKKMIQPTMAAERARTARRATSIAKREATKASAARVASATTAAPKKKLNPGVAAAAKKAAGKTTPKAKPKLSQSEKDFLAGQKAKAKITKKTGVYPNTAN